jgi:hypothetical protein
MNVSPGAPSIFSAQLGAALIGPARICAIASRCARPR